MLPKMPGLTRLWEHLLLLESSLSPGHQWGTGQAQAHGAKCTGALCLSRGHSQEEKGKGIGGQFLSLPQAQLRCLTTRHCCGLRPLYGAQDSRWSCFCKSRRLLLHPTVAEASHSLVSASRRQGGGSGQCHPVPVPCQRRRLWVRRGGSTRGSNADPRFYRAPASNSILGLPWRGWVSAGRSFLHMARIQHLEKDTHPTPLLQLSEALPCFQDPVPDPVVRRCSEHLGPCLACSLPWSSCRQSQYQQADAGDQLAEATPKSPYSFLSPMVLWDAQKVLCQADRGAAEQHLAARPSPPPCLPRLPVGAWASSLPGDPVSGNRSSLGAAPPALQAVGGAAISPTPAAQPATVPIQIAWPSALGVMKSRHQ